MQLCRRSILWIGLWEMQSLPPSFLPSFPPSLLPSIPPFLFFTITSSQPECLPYSPCTCPTT